MGREDVRRAFAGAGPDSIVYEDVLQPDDIREVLAGIRDARSPGSALPLLSWMASHANTPEDVLRDLYQDAPREVLMSLSMNRTLPADLRHGLMNHADEEVRVHANHAHGRLGLGRN